MPAPPSRIRSRRARSSWDSVSSAPASRRSTGSASRVSSPVAASMDHSRPVRAVPDTDRRKTTRLAVRGDGEAARGPEREAGRARPCGAGRRPRHRSRARRALAEAYGCSLMAPILADSLGRMAGTTNPGVLFVHAHPDDECINNGASMAMYASEGRPVTLVTCTRGEEGEVLVPDTGAAGGAARRRAGRPPGDRAGGGHGDPRRHRPPVPRRRGALPRQRDDGRAHQRAPRLLLAGRPRRGRGLPGRGAARGAAAAPSRRTTTTGATATPTTSRPTA